MHRPSRAFAGILAFAAFGLAVAALFTGAAWLSFASAAIAATSALSLIYGVRQPLGELQFKEAADSPAEPEITRATPEPTATIPVAPGPVAAPAAEPTPQAQDAVAVAAPIAETHTDAVAPTPHAGPVASVPSTPDPVVTAPVVRPTAPARVPVSPEPDDVLDALLETVSRYATPVSASLWLEDPATATMRRISARGSLLPSEDFERAEGSLLGQAVAGGAATFGSMSRMRQGGGETAIRRFAVPLSSGEARGAVALDMTGSEPDRAALAGSVAALRGPLTGALALHVSRVETDTARTLIDAAHDLSRLLTVDDVVQAALDRAARLSKAQTASVMLLGDDGRLRIAAARGLPATVVEDTAIGEGEGIAGWVLASGQPVVVEDLEGRGPQSRRHGIRSAISVPIADEDGLIGVLNVGSRRMQARFSRSHVEALETLGVCTALALRNARAQETSTDLFFESLRALAVAIETQDPFARGGTDRIVDVAGELGLAFALSDDEMRALRIASLLHDIGMGAAGEGVSMERRGLSTVEWGMVKLHPRIAAEILDQAPALREVVPIVVHHHERYDGAGYLGGVSGERIPLAARILSVADAWVAMTSERPYRPALDERQALAELTKHSGTQFDPLVIEVFIELHAEGRIPSVPAREVHR